MDHLLRNMKRFLFTCSMLWLSNLQAEKLYECAGRNLKRYIKITSPSETELLPCFVKYSKPEEGEKEFKVLWQAQNNFEFCKEKANYLLEKLRNSQFICQELPSLKPE